MHLQQWISYIARGERCFGIMKEGGLYLLRMDTSNGEVQWAYYWKQDSVYELLGGGMHTNDHNEGQYGKYCTHMHLPHKSIFKNIVEKEYRWPSCSSGQH